MKNPILLIIVCAAFVVQLHAGTEPELKGFPSELAAYLTGLPPTISISDEGIVKAPADRALLTFKVSTESKSLKDALQANQEVRSKLTGFLKERGIEGSRIQAGRFSSTEKHSVFSDKVKSHRVDNLVKVTAANEQEFQGAAGAPDKFPEVSYVGVDFEHSDKEKLKASAVIQACDHATQRKEAFETSLGMKLTPRRFLDGAMPGSAFPTGDNRALVPFVTGTYRAGYGGLPPDAPLAGEPETAFGELVFRAQVTIEYIVEKK